LALDANTNQVNITCPAANAQNKQQVDGQTQPVDPQQGKDHKQVKNQ